MNGKIDCEYLKELQERVQSLPETDIELGRRLERVCTLEEYKYDAHIRRFERQLGRNAPNFKLKIEKLQDLTKLLLPPYYSDVLAYIIQHATDHAYTIGYSRKPFRTNELSAHWDTILWKCFALHAHAASGLHSTELLTQKTELAEYSIKSDIIAYEIDQQNPQILDQIQLAVFGDNNIALVSRNLIKGIVMSHDKKMHTLLGQLLVAARLQEGLRQSIVETMDEGCLEATTCLMNVILEHDLIRFSSVVRAMSVWTGIAFDVENKRVLKQTIHFMHEALTDEASRVEGLTSKNANELYISLWATAVQEEKQLPAAADDVLKNGESYQKVAALYLMHESENLSAKYSVAAANLGVSNTEVEAIVIANYPDTYDYKTIFNIQRNVKSITDGVNYIPELRDNGERNHQFLTLMDMFLAAPKKEITLTFKLGTGVEFSYSADSVARKILYLISYDRDVQKLNKLLAHKEILSSETKGVILENFLHNPEDPTQRNFIFSSLSDRSSQNRWLALKKVERLSLDANEIVRVEALLKLKTGTIRQSAINILMKLEKNALRQSINRLLSSNQELLRLGGLEILTEIHDKKRDQFSFFQNEHLAISQPTQKEQLLLDKLKAEEPDDAQIGFGLYNPQSTFHFFVEQAPIKALLLHDFLSIEKDRFAELLRGLDGLVLEHKDTSYELEWYGSMEVYLIGAEINRGNLYHREEHEKGITSLPLAEVWKSYMKEQKATASELFQLEAIFSLQEVYDYYVKLCQNEANRSTASSKWRKELLESLYPMEKMADFIGIQQEMVYMQQIKEIITAFFEDRDSKAFFDATSRILDTLIQAVPEEMRKDQSGLYEYMAHPWLEWMTENSVDDACFVRYFTSKYVLYTSKKFRSYQPSLEEINRAFSLALIDRNECYRELLERDGGEYGHHLYHLTQDNRSQKFEALKELKHTLVERLLEIELKRGELPTPVSSLVEKIAYFEGVEYFFSILKALEGNTLARGYFYSFDEHYAKKDMMSQLLKNCHPRKGDTSDHLARMCNEFPISEKRLLEAAMYAPQWTDLIADYLGWNGLKKAIWYFHAHTSEVLSAEKETIIAQFSPISPEQFNDGAFDLKWFKEAHDELGEERFELLYQCAKYISMGALHRRAQLFADAAMGKLDPEELKTSAQIKRNKEHLLSYSLLPVVSDVEETILERYEFIQQFLTESKSFGAQRRTSEAKVVEIALENLAETGGYQDSIRMRWVMEAKKIESLKPYTIPVEVEGYQVYIVIDKNGKSRLQLAKNGKELASLPAKLKKNDYVQKLKEIHTELKNQARRNRTELEKSMVRQSKFSKNELEQMIQNPTVEPMVKNLIFQVGNRFGFLEKSQLVQENGEIYALQEADQVRIAHCVDLHMHGVWEKYQRILFDRQIVQPFKQVFRELYVLNADEKTARFRSARYAGHQLQPAKALALFRGRSWTVYYEEGLQKVDYQENIIATVDAMADWFSPADIESPTIEHVAFFERKTAKALELADVPPILFSETMRDVDLAISIAHVGGVDPQASLTTIEMRKAIIRESIRLTQTANVHLKENFAYIEGTLGSYGVHLGSGSVQKQATGSLYLIPVHSQHRGKLFLPFLDEDPKTAEILAKILLLANDKKIKDPHILAQING